jgi:hypothetical protein
MLKRHVIERDKLLKMTKSLMAFVNEGIGLIELRRALHIDSI